MSSKNNNQLNIPQTREAMDKSRCRLHMMQMYLLHLKYEPQCVAPQNTYYTCVFLELLT